MLFLFAKFVFYVLFTFGLAHVIAIEGFTLGTDSKYSEYSLTENLQITFVLISAALFLGAAYLNEQLKTVSLALFALMAMIVVRESDIYLDNYVFDGAWQVLVSLILVSIGVYLWRSRKQLRVAITHYSQLMSNGFLICGLVVTLVFSRIMGRGVFWQSVMGEHYAHFRSVKNIVEESTELLGYSLILFAAVELVLFCFKSKRQSDFMLSSEHVSIAHK